MPKLVLTCRLLGAPEVLVGDRPVTEFNSNKTRALLYYLAVTGQAHSRASLAGLFWGEMPDDKAQTNLRKSIANLRKMVEPWLDANRQTVALRRDNAVVDCLQFENEATPALYRGDFLEGFFIRDASEFERWQLTQRARLRDVALRQFYSQLQRHLAERAFEEAIATAQRLIEIEPWHEEAHRALMLLFARAGQRSAALAQFERCRQTLDHELGVPVTDETGQLYTRIQLNDGPRNNLPIDASQFIGRDKELQQVAAHLATPHCRLLTLVGPGGSGKTRLATAAGRQQLLHFLEGVWFVDLVAVTDVDGLVTTMARALNMPITARQALDDQLLEWLSEQERMIILDNFEQLTAAASYLARILESAPNIKLLVTSRVTLNFLNERTVTVSGLEIEKPAGDETHQSDAVRLFVTEVRRRVELFQLSENLSEIIEICRLVAGSPLAIRLAAALAAALPCQQVVTLLEKDLSILQADALDMPARHQSVAAVFDQMWQLMSDELRNAYRDLSIFRGNFDFQALNQVTGVGIAALQQLQRQALLNRLEDQRYELHPLLHQFARSKLEEDTKRLESLHAKMVAYYLPWLAQQEIGLHSAESPSIRQHLRREAPNWQVAWRAAAAIGETSALNAAIVALINFYYQASEPREGMRLFSEALQLVQENSLRAALQVAVGRLGLLARETERVQTAAAEALSFGLEDPFIDAGAYYVQGVAAYDLGDHAGSLAHCEKALAIADANGLDEYASRALNQMGRVYLARHQAGEARVAFEKAIDIAESHHYLDILVSLQQNLGLVELRDAKSQAARAAFLTALEGANSLNLVSMQASLSLNIGTSYMYESRIDEGQAYYEKAHALYFRTGEKTAIAIGNVVQAVTAAERGQWLDARRYRAQAFRLYREAGQTRREEDALDELIHVEIVVGNYEAAGRFIQERLASSNPIAPTPRLAAHLHQIWMGLETGQLEMAQEYFALVEDVEEAEHPPHINASLHFTRSRYHFYRHSFDAALQHAERGVDHCRQNLARGLPQALIRLGHTMTMLEQADAEAIYQEALDLYETIGQEHLAVEAAAGLARYAYANGYVAEARTGVERIMRFLDRPTSPHTFLGCQEPALIYYWCFEILKGMGDPRADSLQQEAIDYFERRALRTDPLWRDAFWQDVWLHKQLKAATP